MSRRSIRFKQLVKQHARKHTNKRAEKVVAVVSNAQTSRKQVLRLRWAKEAYNGKR